MKSQKKGGAADKHAPLKLPNPGHVQPFRALTNNKKTKTRRIGWALGRPRKIIFTKSLSRQSLAMFLYVHMLEVMFYGQTVIPRGEKVSRTKSRFSIGLGGRNSGQKRSSKKKHLFEKLTR